MATAFLCPAAPCSSNVTNLPCMETTSWYGIRSFANGTLHFSFASIFHTPQRRRQSLASLQSDLRRVQSLRRNFALMAASLSEGRTDSRNLEPMPNDRTPEPL